MKSLAWAMAVLVATLTGCSLGPSSGIKKEAEDAVRHELRDPDSAQFRYAYEDMEVFPDDGVVCGEVNSRNGYGGLTGFQGFAYVRGQGVALASTDATPSTPLDSASVDRYIGFINRCIELLRQRTAREVAALNTTNSAR